MACISAANGCVLVSEQVHHLSHHHQGPYKITLLHRFQLRGDLIGCEPISYFYSSLLFSHHICSSFSSQKQTESIEALKGTVQLFSHFILVQFIHTEQLLCDLKWFGWVGKNQHQKQKTKMQIPNMIDSPSDEECIYTTNWIYLL